MTAQPVEVDERAGAGGAVVVCVGLVHVYQVSGVDTAALRGIDFDAASGETVALFGPSGSGKSTLLAVLAGIRQPSAGAIWVDGNNIARASEGVLRRYRRDTASVLLQDAGANLLPYASAADNVRYAQRGRHSRHGRRGPELPAVAELLEAVGLRRSERTRPVTSLSRGKQQAAALATALANGPRLLLADEPTSELRPDEANRLIANMLTLTRRLGVTVIVVTHNPEVAAAMDRTLRLREGRVGAEEIGAHESGRRQSAVVGSDGSIQLPDALFATWPAGTRVLVEEVDGETLRLRRPEPGR